MNNMKKSVCPPSNQNSPERELSYAHWRLLKIVSQYLGIQNRPLKTLKKRFYTLSLDQQLLVTQTWLRLGYLQGYGLCIGLFNHDEVVVLMDTPLDLLTLLLDAVEQDIDAAIWQWSITKELLDHISAMKAIEEALA